MNARAHAWNDGAAGDARGAVTDAVRSARLFRSTQSNHISYLQCIYIYVHIRESWGDQTLTHHFSYVASYTDPLLFLFEQTHNYPVDDQGLSPWMSQLSR